MTCNKCGKELEANTKICDACGEAVAETAKPKKKKNKKLIAIIAVVVAAIILVVSLGSGSEDSKTLTVPYENETGAVMNMTLDEYNEKFGSALDELFIIAGGQAANFDLSQFWSNKVEPMVGYEESGAEYTLYTAFLTGTHIGAAVQDNKISKIDICFDYDNNDLAVSCAAATVMLCSGLEFEEANELFETVRGGIKDNTMVYKDGILYCVTASTVSYTIMAASEDFVQSLEESGNCNVIRR